MQNCLLVQFYSLVLKYIRAKVSSCNFVHSCNVVPSCNFVRSCKFDSYPLKTANQQIKGILYTYKLRSTFSCTFVYSVTNMKSYKFLNSVIFKIQHLLFKNYDILLSSLSIYFYPNKFFDN